MLTTTNPTHGTPHVAGSDSTQAGSSAVRVDGDSDAVTRTGGSPLNGDGALRSTNPSVNRDKFKRALDAFTGVCILALYFLYFSVVKGMWSAFDCQVNKTGESILTADPSVHCHVPGGVQEEVCSCHCSRVLSATSGSWRGRE